MLTVSCYGCVVTQMMYVYSLCGKISSPLMLFNMRPVVTVLFLNSFVYCVLEITLNKISWNLMFWYKNAFLGAFEILSRSCKYWFVQVCLHETTRTSEFKQKLGRENETHIFFEYPFSVSPMAFEGITQNSIPINQPTRCNSFSHLLLDVYVRLNMFRASSRPSSGAQQLQ